MVLKFKNLHKNFQQGSQKIRILENAEFELNKGETVAIVGPSGSGKSTLLSMIAGLEAPDSGEIMVQEKSITKMSEAELAKFRGTHLGIVFQQFHLISQLTALENTTLPLELTRRISKNEAREKAEKILEKVGLGDRLNHYPSTLSGGECQRVAISRAFVTEPSLILADEPSGNLDQKMGEQVMEYLFSLVRGSERAMVLVTHDPLLAKKCSRQIRLKEGQLVSEKNE